jgi:RND family efflux transporter MFP subunit
MNRKSLIAVLIIVVIVLAIVVTLFQNKTKINAANQVVDRSSIPVSVTTQKVVTGKLEINLALPALLKPFEEASVFVQTPGIISYLNLELGNKVRKGEVIGAIDTKIAAINLKTAELNNSKLNDDYQRAKELFEGKATTEVNATTAKFNFENSSIQIEQIKQQIANANIVAPISGIISAKSLKAGEFANPGVPIATITNINTLKSTVFVDQSMIYTIKINESAEITSALFPNKILIGKVIYMSPKADLNHNYQVDLLITNSGSELLRAGTDVIVSFNNIKRNDVLQIPKTALVLDRQEPFVYVSSNGKAVGRSIKVGSMQNDLVEVLSGLEVGEVVITSGQINLKDGSNINIIN